MGLGGFLCFGGLESDGVDEWVVEALWGFRGQKCFRPFTFYSTSPRLLAYHGLHPNLTTAQCQYFQQHGWYTSLHLSEQQQQSVNALWLLFPSPIPSLCYGYHPYVQCRFSRHQSAIPFGLLCHYHPVFVRICMHPKVRLCSLCLEGGVYKVSWCGKVDCV